MKAKKFATQMDEDILKDLKAYAQDSGKSISGVLTEAVSEYLKRVKVRPAFLSAMEESLRENEELLKKLAE